MVALYIGALGALSLALADAYRSLRVAELELDAYRSKEALGLHVPPAPPSKLNAAANYAPSVRDAARVAPPPPPPPSSGGPQQPQQGAPVLRLRRDGPETA